ncbi:hypothetical protein BKI52_28905 [marine bacterium AO1-C]|nr:hypothetical protein BKI52_28905 [marine bacterium AO1-C]
MPLIHIEHKGPQCSWGIWEIEENSQELVDLLSPRASEANYLKYIEHEKKRCESAAARLVIKQILEQKQEEYFGILKDANNKPYLSDASYNISLSHTDQYAVGIVHQSKAVGIDVEMIREKLLKISNRVLSQEEQQAVKGDLEMLTVYWSAKETLYKIHSKRQLFFNRDLIIDPFQLQQKGILQAYIRQDNGQLKPHQVYYHKFKNYYICFGYGG